MDISKLNQVTLRKKETQKAYMEYLKTKDLSQCFICHRELLVKEYKQWLLIKNKFGYDAVYSNHLLLCPKRHVQEMYELNMDETAEMWEILNSDLKYNQAILNKRGDRSLLAHFHWHLVTIGNH